MITLKEILYDYAYTKGGGLPLTPQEMCNAVVQWVQKYLNDEKYVKELTNQDSFVTLAKSTNASGDVVYNVNLDIARLVAELDNQFEADNFLNAFTLNDKIVGSDSVVVNISNDNKKLVISLADFYKDRIQVLDDKAILKPDSLTAESVPVVGTTGEVSYKPVSELGGGVYIHTLRTVSNTGEVLNIVIYSSNETQINSVHEIYNIAGSYIMCSGNVMGDSFFGSANISPNEATITVSGVKVNVSDEVSGVYDRLLTITSITDTVKQI